MGECITEGGKKAAKGTREPALPNLKKTPFPLLYVLEKKEALGGTNLETV